MSETRTGGPAPRPGFRRLDAPAVAFLVVFALGAALRAWRLGAAGYDGDEPFELQTRAMILEHGAPWMPSGVLWPYGGVLQYFGALGTAIGGVSVFWNRLPFALLGLAAVWVVYRTGRRTLSPWAGVVAAAALALHPGHVQWSANVKVYGAMSLLVAWAADRWLAWVVERDDRAAGGFAAAMVLAALCHPAAAFVVAGFAAAGVVARGPRWVVAGRTLAAFAACAAALGFFWWLMRTFDPAFEQVVAAPATGAGGGSLLRTRVLRLLPSLASHGWHSAWHAVPFWVAAGGAIAAIVRSRRVAEPSDAGRLRAPALLFLVWLVALGTFTLLSRDIGSMYLLPASPLLALAAGGGVVALAALVPAGVAGLAGPGIAATALAAHAALTGPSWPAALDRNEGIARVMAAVADGARDGEVSFGGGPQLVLVSGGRLRDYMVYGGDLAASAFVRDGRAFDRIYGNPVLRTVDDVRPVFEAAPRAWYLVTDKELATGRVTAEVDAWLRARMEPVATAGSVRLFASRLREPIR